MAPLRIDLGCGQSKREGFTGIDIAAVEGVDIVHDLTKTPWPLGSESVEEVNCSHFLEHLTGTQRIPFMNELYRVMKPGAQAQIVVPHWASMRAVQDPTHQWPPIAESSFLYFNKGWRTENRLDHYAITCDFDFSYGYVTEAQWGARSQESRDFAVKHYQNVIIDLAVTLTKREPS